MKSEIVLQVIELKKHFDQVKAVDGINFSITKAEIFGFLGPNGSGKTTTIGMILGLIHPTSGIVRLFGHPVSPFQPSPLRRVGSLVGAPSLVPYLSARQNLEMIGRIYPEGDGLRIEEILAEVGLTRFANRKVGSFSTGMNQRLGLGMALMHKPELLILDEPTNGMDPSGMHEVRNMLVKLVDQGVTIFFSSHLLHEIEQICDRVAVIKEGKIVAQGKVEDLVGQKSIVKVRVESPRQAAQLIRNLPGRGRVRVHGEYVTVNGISSEVVIGHLVANGLIPSEVTNGSLDLEAIFLELTNQAAVEV